MSTASPSLTPAQIRLRDMWEEHMKMDWMLPGVKPTGRRVEVPLVAIIGFKDGKVRTEHIYWDQASVLVQIGLLDPSKLPVAGIEATRKVQDASRPSNTLIERAGR